MSHDAGDREVAEKLTAAFVELDKTLKAHLTATSNTNTNHNIIDTGSKFLWIGLWLSMTCCIVMFVMSWKQTDEISSMRAMWLESSRKQEANADRMSIMLQWAPNLRDEVNKEMEKRNGPEKAHSP